MAPGRARDEQKERQWRRWIDQWRVSGLTVRAFCGRHGLATPSFYAWRRTLERRAAEKAAFVSVQVVADAPDIFGVLEKRKLAIRSDVQNFKFAPIASNAPELFGLSLKS